MAISTKGSPHAFILGIPGQGKSVTTRRIIREFASQGLPSLILDFHGDMAAAPPPGAQVVDAAEGLRFSPFELPSLRGINVGQRDGLGGCRDHRLRVRFGRHPARPRV